MSAAKEAPPPPADGGGAPKKSKKMIFIAAGALLLVIVIAVAAVLLLKKPPAEEGEEDTAHEVKKEKSKKKKDEKHGPPAYLKIEPYTINLKGEQGDQYLRLEMSVEFGDMKEADAAKNYMPKIRHQTMQLLKGKSVAELNTKEGTEKLAVDLKNEINLILGEPEKGEKYPSGPIKEVLFTDLVIQ